MRRTLLIGAAAGLIAGLAWAVHEAHIPLFPVQIYSNDPSGRMKQLIAESEELEKIRDEWERLWGEAPGPADEVEVER